MPLRFLSKSDERYTSCLNLVSVVTPEMKIKSIVLPDALLLYQKSLHQDVILSSNFTINELFQGFYQDSKSQEEGKSKETEIKFTGYTYMKKV